MLTSSLFDQVVIEYISIIVKEVQKVSETENRKPKKKPARRRRRKSGAFSQLLAVLFVFLAVYLILSLFVVGMIYYSFNDTAKNTEIYSLNVVFDERTLHKLDATEANNEYGLYIPFTYLSEISSFGIAGGGDDVTLFIIGTENRIECQKNSSLIVINGNPVRISSPILYRDNEFYIPVSLIEKYINGIDITYDNEKMICQVSSDIGKSDIALSMLLPEGMKNADFPDSYKYYGDVSGDESGA